MRLTHLNVKHNRNSPVAYGEFEKCYFNFSLYTVPETLHILSNAHCVIHISVSVSYDSELFCPVPVKYNRNLDSSIFIIYGQQYIIGK